MTDFLSFCEACRDGDLSKVELMIANGSRCWNDGLYSACWGGHLSIIKLLIAKGANNWNTGMRGACSTGHLQIVEFMIAQGADDWYGGLYNAALNNHLKIAKLVIESGSISLHMFTIDQKYELLEMGLSIQTFIYLNSCPNLIQEIQYFQKQIRLATNCYLIPDLLNIIANYSLK